jgi:3,4-dihydroxy-2-butanone 4-phosphate synthase
MKVSFESPQTVSVAEHSVKFNINEYDRCNTSSVYGQNVGEEGPDVEFERPGHDQAFQRE